MVLSVKSDDTKPGGGFAILEGSELRDVAAVSVENCYLGLFLGEDGRWAKVPALLPVEPVPDHPNALSLGPHIVDFIATDLQIAVRGEGGADFGKVFWADIIPSRNCGALTAKDVIAEMNQRKLDRERQAQEAQAQEAQDQEAQAQEIQAQERQAREAQARENSERERLEADKRQRDDAELERQRKDKRIELPAYVVVSLVSCVAVIVVCCVIFWPKPPVPVAQGLILQQRDVHPGPSQETEHDHVLDEHPTEPPTPAGLTPRGDRDASFTCRPDLDEPVAQLICADAELADADARMGRVFNQRFASSSSATTKRTLMQDQRAWLIQRNTKCGVPYSGSYTVADLAPYKPCVLDMTSQRAKELETR